ncbi:MAG TPA: hypothetical protein VH684_26440 [Xanthobacteraceae bacterium]|jgi:hypothetical protein
MSFGDEALAFNYGFRRGVHKTSLKLVLVSNLQQDRVQRSEGNMACPIATPFRQHAPIMSRKHRASPSRIRYSGLQRWAMRLIARPDLAASRW